MSSYQENQSYNLELHFLLDHLIELVWPTRCIVCDTSGKLLCDNCRQKLKWIQQRYACPICGTPHGWLTCTNCGAEALRERRAQKNSATNGELAPYHWEARTTISALEFSGSGALLVTTLKDSHELRLAPIIAAVIATALDEAASWTAADGCARYDFQKLDGICFVPASPSAFLRRGFDHMELISQALAALLGLPVCDVLLRHESRDQRELDRQSRLRNLEGSVEVIDDVAGARLLLVDDVITTGATLRESTRVLLERGAESVTACSLARAW